MSPVFNIRVSRVGDELVDPTAPDEAPCSPRRSQVDKHLSKDSLTPPEPVPPMLPASRIC
jgi:hypothetical protein